MPKEIYALDCGHGETSAVVMEQTYQRLETYCVKCRAYVTVSETYGFYARCLNCTYARRFGMAELTAEVKSAKHALRNPGHKVKLIGPDGNEIKEKQFQQATLFEEDPPF